MSYIFTRPNIFSFLVKRKVSGEVDVLVKEKVNKDEADTLVKGKVNKDEIPPISHTAKMFSSKRALTKTQRTFCLDVIARK